MKNIIINHPDGNVTLQEIQNDVNVAILRYGSNELAFTAKTVQALIDKINTLSNNSSEVFEMLKEVTETLERVLDSAYCQVNDDGTVDESKKVINSFSDNVQDASTPDKEMILSIVEKAFDNNIYSTAFESEMDSYSSSVEGREEMLKEIKEKL